MRRHWIWQEHATTAQPTTKCKLSKTVFTPDTYGIAFAGAVLVQQVSQQWEVQYSNRSNARCGILRLKATSMVTTCSAPRCRPGCCPCQPRRTAANCWSPCSSPRFPETQRTRYFSSDKRTELGQGRLQREGQGCRSSSENLLARRVRSSATAKSASDVKHTHNVWKIIKRIECIATHPRRFERGVVLGRALGDLVQDVEPDVAAVVATDQHP